MTKIRLENVSLTYPIYGSSSRSIKRDIANLMTGRKSKALNAITSVNALQDISFALNDGDTLGLIGHNGAGKSSLLKVLAGIYEINQGSMNIDGSVSALLGSVVGMQPELNGYENIKINCIVKDYSKPQTQAIIDDVVEFTELGDFLTIPVKMYSSGMQARLAFAISTAVYPDILLLDEVFGTGDASFVHKATERMKGLLRQANILIMANHSMEILKQFCKQAMWLDHGKVRAFGEIDDVCDRYLASMSIVTA